MVDGVDLHLSKEEADALIHILGKMDYYLVGHLLSGMSEDVVENTVGKINSSYRKLVRDVWK